MPKNDNSDKNQDKVETVDVAPQAPAPASSISARRWGTGVIIGLSAASLALLAGVFGGGVAVGATAGNHAPSGSGGHSEQASDSMRQGGPMHDGSMQQSGPMHDGSMHDSDSDGPMDGKMPHEPGAKGQGPDMMPRGTTDSGTGTSSSTPAPTN